jgi:hypothetical protein
MSWRNRQHFNYGWGNLPSVVILVESGKISVPSCDEDRMSSGGRL